MGLDQIHEQNNKIIKGSGGASDLLNKEEGSALFRWEVCSLELACEIQEFEDCLDRNDFVADSISKHHEDNDSFNQRFTSDINKLVNSIPVNPFNKTSLTKLNTPKMIVPEAVRNVIHDGPAREYLVRLNESKTRIDYRLL